MRDFCQHGYIRRRRQIRKKNNGRISAIPRKKWLRFCNSWQNTPHLEMFPSVAVSRQLLQLLLPYDVFCPQAGLILKSDDRYSREHLNKNPTHRKNYNLPVEVAPNTTEDEGALKKKTDKSQP